MKPLSVTNVLLFPLMATCHATAQKPQMAEFFEDPHYQGRSVSIPIDGKCHKFYEFEPNLTMRVSSLKTNGALTCLIWRNPSCEMLYQVFGSDAPQLREEWDNKAWSVKCNP